MKSLQLHPWDVTPAEAKEIQLQLGARVELDDRLPEIRCVAGADLALELPAPRSWKTREGQAIAGIVAYRFPDMEEVERVNAVVPLTFPYVPGLLSFREIPALLGAIEQLKCTPDLIFCDGQGYAHPRRFGLASHLGVLLDLPTIGVAKSLLIGEHGRVARPAGSAAPLRDPKSSETIGMALRTKTGIKPVFVSQGHRVSLVTAVKLTMAVAGDYRIPQPTRDADLFVNAIRRDRNKPSAAAKRPQMSR
jgi:deoxyribonuclease V